MNCVFANPIYGGQDPFVTRAANGKYYYVAEDTGSRSISVYESDRLTDRGVRHVVYTAPESGPSSYDLWAPEIWNLRGKWYIYYAGAQGAGMPWWNTHRMFVLEAEHPLGPYRQAGELELGDAMSIDGTVLELPDGRLYFVYMRSTGDGNKLFIAPMESPTRIGGEPVLLSQPELSWEADINEGPFPIVRDGRVMVLYAANAAHLPEYCLGLLRCHDTQNILNREAWTKDPEPLFRQRGNVYGPGHACITQSPDGTQDYLMYHSKFDLDCSLPGGWNRVVNIKSIEWADDGTPILGTPPQYGEALPLPAGEAAWKGGEALDLDMGQACGYFAEYAYFREKTIFWETDYLQISGDIRPDFGDKVILRERVYRNFYAELTLDTKGGEAGLLLRIQQPATGRCCWQGMAVLTDGHQLTISRCDGQTQEVLAAAAIPEDARTIRVHTAGSCVSAECGGVRIQAPCSADAGFIGCIALDAQARFYALRITPEAE